MLGFGKTNRFYLEMHLSFAMRHHYL